MCNNNRRSEKFTDATSKDFPEQVMMSALHLEGCLVLFLINRQTGKLCSDVKSCLFATMLLLLLQVSALTHSRLKDGFHPT